MKPIIIFGAGLIGELTLRAARARGQLISCLADDRRFGILQDHFVLTTANVREAYRDAHFVLTSPNPEGQVDRLRELGFTSWESCERLLEGFDIASATLQPHEYSPAHMRYLVDTCIANHRAYLKPERLALQSLDLMVTEKCSMKCKDCSNLMQYYEKPEDAPVEETCATIDALLSEMDEVQEFRLIGGEPFMHRELHRFAAHCTAHPKIAKVCIFTNGTVMPREWAAFEHPKIHFFITNYDALSRKLRPLVAELEARKIGYVCEHANEWTDCASLEKHNRTEAENKGVFADCCARHLATLHQGRLYRCPFAANAFSLKAVPDYAGDYLPIHAPRAALAAFLRGKGPLGTCDHCNGRSFGAPLIEPAIQAKKPLTYHRYV